MRFNINLASQPYEAARRFRRQMSSVVAALALLGVILLGYIAYQRIHSRDVNRQLAAVRKEIDSLNQEEAQARAILNRPENREVAAQSDFLNQLFVRKALSWTRVFAVMERIMPYDIHVVSMKPEYTKADDLMLHIVVATGSYDKAVELVRRMEKSNHFQQAEIMAQTVTANLGDQSAGPGNIQFDIAAVYLPGGPDTDAAEQEADKSAGPAQVTASAAKPQTTPAGVKAPVPGANPVPVTSPNPVPAQTANQQRPMGERQH